MRRAARLMLRKAFLLATWRRMARFRRDLAQPDSAQDAVFRRAIKQLAKTEYGRSFGVSAGDSYAEFAAKVPIVTYEELEPWVERQKREGHRILSGEPIRIYEKTSGSSGAHKHIPYT